MISLDSCFEQFTKSETLADLVHCTSCSENTESSQQHTFRTLPEILCLQLKRFDNAAKRKVTDIVSFPVRGLDMGKYLAQW